MCIRDRKGNVLEPSCGIGNFLGLVPEGMDGLNMYGVELDSISGRIAKLLYPEADITISGFEKTEFPDGFFDVAVGNIPFGGYKLIDRRYDRQKFFVHDYFLSLIHILQVQAGKEYWMYLVLGEKPSVAQAYAKVLGAKKRQDGYLEGNGWLVSWCPVSYTHLDVYKRQGITQNIKDLLASREIENIFENSDFIYMLNQAAGDRQILAKQLNISPHQLSYVTNSGEVEGLIFYVSTIIPFKDKFDTSLRLYSLMTTKVSDLEEQADGR